MKILGISGGSKNGNNDAMCKEALMGAKEAGAEIEFINLNQLHIEHWHRLHGLRHEPDERQRRTLPDQRRF